MTRDGKIPRRALPTIRALAAQAQVRPGPGRRLIPVAAPDAAPAAPGDDAGDGDEDDDIDPTGVVELKSQLLAARVRERNAISRLREIELQHKEGRFVPLEEVQEDARESAEATRAALNAIPQRVALACEGRKAPEIEAIVNDEIQRVIAQQQSRFLE